MLQNRVDPWGALEAVPDRGTLMGNRGTLHNDKNDIVRPWARNAWVTCLLSYKGIRRPKPFSAGNYSELFFLDEATAFAAGHRPCTTCQRDRSMLFKEAWIQANMGTAATSSAVSLSDIDKAIHNERAVRGGGKKTYSAPLRDLPMGAMFEAGGSAYIVGRNGHHLWSFSGIGQAASFGPNEAVRVLTPASIVKAFAAGFVPHSMVTTGRHTAA